MTTVPGASLQFPHRCTLLCTQQWLLQAAVMREQPGLEAWQQWRNQVDIETLDSASHHLLSLLYPNLVLHQIDDPHLGRLKGVYRRTWYANQLLVKKFEFILKALQNTQIATLVLRDVALISTCYSDYGHRPIYHFDIMVHPSNTSAAIEIFKQLGWKLSGYKPPTGERLWKPIKFHDTSYIHLNLHNHLFWANPQAHTDAQLWANSIDTNINNTSTLVLSPVDQLLHLCIKLNQKKNQRPIYWLADAAMLINTLTQEAEWVRLVTQAQRYEIILPLKYLLIELQALLQLSLPDWVVPSLSKMAISYHELLEYNLSPDNKLILLKAMLVRLRQNWINMITLQQSSNL